MPLYRIAALLTCHNRREMTIECLLALRAQASPLFNFEFSMPDGQSSRHPESNIQNQKASIYLDVFLVDDGCTDGTADAVRTAWPEATIIQGNGNLFWCGGMRVAWAHAAKADPDYYLLLNDDTVIQTDAVADLLGLAGSPESLAISVAPIADPETGNVVFGGHRGHEAKPIFPNGTPIACDTMNANCALVTRAVFQKNGMFHFAYTHSMGDYDYGFAASRSGVKILQAGRILGSSLPNSSALTWRDKSLTRRERFRLLWFSAKGLPWGEWLTYTRRNTGFIWPYRAISPALRILAGK